MKYQAGKQHPDQQVVQGGLPMNHVLIVMRYPGSLQALNHLPYPGGSFHDPVPRLLQPVEMPLACARHE